MQRQSAQLHAALAPNYAKLACNVFTAGNDARLAQRELLIDGETYHLHEGEGFLWDDTFMHSAVNRSDQPRVVLLFDVFRRDQPFWLVAISWLFLAIAQLWQRLQNMREWALLRAAAS